MVPRGRGTGNQNQVEIHRACVHRRRCTAVPARNLFTILPRFAPRHLAGLATAREKVLRSVAGAASADTR